MLYIDLIISLFLFIIAIVFLFNGRYRKNVFLIILAIIFFPLSIFSYYLPKYNIEISGGINIFMVIIYPVIKILIILLLINYLKALPNRKGF